MDTTLDSIEKIQADLLEIRSLAEASQSRELSELLRRLANDIEAYARAIDQLA